MGASKRVIAAMILAAAMSAPACAEDAPPDGSMLIVWPDGTATTVKIADQKTMDSTMEDATPAAGAVMIVIHDGQAYNVPDKKMQNGKMMSENLAPNHPLNGRRGASGTPATSGSSGSSSGQQQQNGQPQNGQQQ